MNIILNRIFSTIIYVVLSGLFIAAFFAIYIRVLFEEGHIRFAIYAIILFSVGIIITTACFIRTSYSNPGYIELNNYFLDEENHMINTQAIKDYSLQQKQQIQRNDQRLNDIEIEMINQDKITYDRLYREFEEISDLNNRIYLDLAQRKTYCQKCNLIRPKRSHHCSACNRCIKRLDHHCPFVGNCVGENNTRFFIQFVFYSSLSLLVNFIQGIIYSFTRGFDNNTIFIFYIAAFIAVFFGIAMLVFGIFHIVLVLKNITTLEQDYLRNYNPFDLKSKRLNFEQIMQCKIFSLQTFLPINSSFNQ